MGRVELLTAAFPWLTAKLSLTDEDVMDVLLLLLLFRVCGKEEERGAGVLTREPSVLFPVTCCRLLILVVTDGVDLAWTLADGGAWAEEGAFGMAEKGGLLLIVVVVVVTVGLALDSIEVGSVSLLLLVTVVVCMLFWTFGSG